MQITVQYFAVLRERRGLAKEAVSTSSATAAELYDELDRSHHLELPRTALKVAVNAEFSDWDRQLQDGDTVVFIPPVAGG